MVQHPILRGFLAYILLSALCSQVVFAEGDPSREDHRYVAVTTETLRDTPFANKVPPFSVSERISKLSQGDYYPCTDCHDNDSQKTNPKIRVLEDEHDMLQLKHGGGRIWCLNCHNANNRDMLQGLKNQTISFDFSFLICGQCHFRQQEGFIFGSHGKRLYNWRGTKVLQNCVECHNPHDPQFKKRKPWQAPTIRAGLKKLPKHHSEVRPPWLQGSAVRETMGHEKDNVDVGEGE